MMQCMLLHLLYGTGAGVAVVLAVPAIGIGLDALGTAIAAGVGFALVLTVVGMVLWMRIVLAMEPEPKTAGMFTVFHLIYGVVLGAFVGAGILG
jgi:hypothetical protein